MHGISNLCPDNPRLCHCYLRTTICGPSKVITGRSLASAFIGVSVVLQLIRPVEVVQPPQVTSTVSQRNKLTVTVLGKPYYAYIIKSIKLPPKPSAAPTLLFLSWFQERQRAEFDGSHVDPWQFPFAETCHDVDSGGWKLVRFFFWLQLRVHDSGTTGVVLECQLARSVVGRSTSPDALLCTNHDGRWYEI